jgi:hypothetical protein
MTLSGASLNGVAASIGPAILVGALLWTGQVAAQFGSPGSSGGYDRGRDSDRSRDSSSRDRSDRDHSSRDHSSSSSSSSSTSHSPVTTPSKVRVTVGLPATYADIDTDRDGQLGLYEWKKAKRTLAQFIQLDINKDGFVTPRELERAASMPALAATPASSPSATPTGSASPSSPVASTTPSSSAAPVVASKLTEEEQAKADEAQAKNSFSYLDTDKDGKISAAEMARSSRIRPMFEQAGIKFDEPMSAEQFVSTYVKIRKSQRT